MKISVNNILAVSVLGVIVGWMGSAQAKEWLLEPEGEREIRPAQASPDRDALDQAEQVLIEGQPAKATKLLNKWLKKSPRSPYRAEALYYVSQSLEHQGKLYQAFEKYEQLLERYSNSEFSRLGLEAEFEIAEKFLSGTKRRALGIFKVSGEGVGINIIEKLQERRPGSLLAEKGLMLLGNYYLQKKLYPEAADTYNLLITEYPSSVYVRQARLRAAKAYMNMFEGISKDPVPLIEARERLLQYRQLYQGDEQSNEIEAMLAKINELQAERDYETGRFYERTRKKQAGRFYYEQVLERWPRSKWAAKAQNKLGKLGPA
ncbi:MAG: outer membrane protein assembly factor BamD [Actinobacteria bacterium]|nr:outer membrane protein assembly factor BamD [Actinomycetota bacterium]